MSIVSEIFTAWGDPRAVMARRLASDREEQALFYVLAATLTQAVASLPETVMIAGQAGSPEDELGPLTFATFIFRVIVGSLVLYVIAALARLVARLFGGQGTWFGARLALFWSMFSAAPFFLLSGVVLAIALVTATPFLVQVSSWLGIAANLVLLWVWAGSLAMAEGFRRATVVALVMGGAALAILGAVSLTLPQ